MMSVDRRTCLRAEVSYITRDEPNEWRHTVILFTLSTPMREVLFIRRGPNPIPPKDLSLDYLDSLTIRIVANILQ